MSLLSSLTLIDNKLFGRIPEGLRSLKELQELDLSKNGLTGILPEAHPIVHVEQHLSDGQLGEAQSRLTTLRLSQNMLTGTMPEGLAKEQDWNSDSADP